LHPQQLVVCEQCDALHRWQELAADEVARCHRCAAVIARGHRLKVHALLAVAIAALFVLLIANLTPIVNITLRGAHTDATLPQAIGHIWNDGERLVAVVAALTSIVAPAVMIVLRLIVLLPLSVGRVSRWFAVYMRLLHEAERWSMVEVMTVSAAIAIVRVASLAGAVPGPGVFAFAALALLLAALQSGGLRHLWLAAR
jgi:paraquat-inducible protein A